MSLHSLFITTPKGIEPLLVNELTDFGFQTISPTRAGVRCQGTLAQAYRYCLWSRLANRVLLPLATFPALNPEMLYEGVQTIRWDEHLTLANSLAVEATIIHSNITHTYFAALKVKDAIVDQFRNRYSQRPNVQLDQPDIPIHLHLHHNEATVSIDLSGESLHRRGYRIGGVQAPLKENLAAAMLVQAGWAAIAAEGRGLIDPLCGSGTLLIEAAFIAGDRAPNLLRHYFGFLRWQGHDAQIWRELLAEAQQRYQEGLAKIPPIIGYDADSKAIKIALSQIETAQLTKKIHVERRTLAQLTPPSHPPGLVIANPPYGERLGNQDELKPLYDFFGEQLRRHFQGWQAAVLVGDIELGKQIGIRSHKRYTLYNGALACKLLQFEITPQWFMSSHPTATVSSPSIQASAPNAPKKTVSYSAGAQMLANRLRKNLKQLGSWAKREQISCFRLYDADLPEYALAIDIYEQWVHVQEYAPPKTIATELAQTRLQEALTVIAQELNLSPANIFLKVRRPQKGLQQYQKHNNTEQFYEVHESKAIFLLNLTDYLDTGLFLDHRLTRQMISELAAGQHFLNLFGYTGTATVHAALGGASSTTTVDLSKNYLAWARRNLARNGLSEHRHQLIQADVLTWLQQEATRLAANKYKKYGLIFLDPPTFSNSKRLKKTNAHSLDIQRDHVTLIRLALQCLNKDGILLFSTNYQKFKLETTALTDIKIEDISRLTLPKDFERHPRIHQCWKMSIN